MSRNNALLTGAVVGSVVTIFSVAVWLTPSGATAADAAPKTSACKDVAFIGARGSGQPAGFGNMVQATFDSYKTKTNKSIEAIALEYPAVPIPVIDPAITAGMYFASVDAGRSNLLETLSERKEKCPNQKVYLAGYSQGANAISSALSQGSQADLKNVEGVVLYGDPNFNPAFVGNVGNFARGQKGIASSFTTLINTPNYVKPTLESKTRSYCILNDPICSYGPQSMAHCSFIDNPCAHELYRSQGLTDQGASFLASMTAKSSARQAMPTRTNPRLARATAGLGPQASGTRMPQRPATQP